MTASRTTGIALVICLGAMAMGSGAALAQSAGAKAAAARHENFKPVGAASKALRDELAKGTPDRNALNANARKLALLSTQLPTWFPKGSGPESKFKTRAKANIWSDAAGFASASKALQVETGKFQTLAAGGDVAAIKAQYRAVGGACKACHDKYRVPED